MQDVSELSVICNCQLIFFLKHYRFKVIRFATLQASPFVLCSVTRKIGKQEIKNFWFTLYKRKSVHVSTCMKIYKENSYYIYKIFEWILVKDGGGEEKDWYILLWNRKIRVP